MVFTRTSSRAQPHALDRSTSSLREMVADAAAQVGESDDAFERLREALLEAREAGDGDVLRGFEDALSDVSAAWSDHDESLDLADAIARDAGLAASSEAGSDASSTTTTAAPRSGIDSALESLSRLIGLLPPESGDRRLDHIFDDDRARAERTAAFVKQLGDAFGLDGDIVVKVDAEAAMRTHAEGALGLFQDDVVYLDPSRYDASGADDRALLAHELTHAAQSRLTTDVSDADGAEADLAPCLDAAEAEAYAIMQDARAGRALAAPEAALPEGELAACGPRATAEKNKKKTEREKPDPKKQDAPEPEKKPEPGTTTKPGPEGGPEPTTIKDPPPGRTKPPTRVEDPPPQTTETKTTIETETDAAGECLDACAMPLPEHAQAPQVQRPGPAATGAGKIIKLSIAGHIVNIRLPETAQPGRVSVRFRPSDSPYKALNLKSAVIELDENFDIKGGAISCGVRLGKFVQADNVALAIYKKGFVVARIQGAKVQVGPNISGLVDLDLNPLGVTGRARFTSDKIKLPNGMVVRDGMVDVVVAAGGSVSAHGRLTVEVPGLGAVTLDACFVDGELRGHLTFDWTRPVRVAPGVVLERLHLEGCYRKDAWWVAGDADLGVIEKFGATVRAKYNRSGQTSWFEIAGDVQQRAPIALGGGVSLENGKAHVAWLRDHWDPATASFDFAWREVRGHVEGTYDIASKKLTADGEAHTERTMKLGETGASLDLATLRAKIVENELIEIEGKAKVVLPYQGQDTFQIDAQAHYLVKDQTVDAKGSVVVLRDVGFGPTGGLHATMKKDSSGGFTMEKNAIIELGGDLAFEVHHGQHEVGKGGVSFKGGNLRELDGAADFRLTNKTGMPNVEAGPLYLLEGGSFHLDIVKSKLGVAEAKDVAWELLHKITPTKDGPGKISGAMAGKYDFAIGEATLDGSAKVEEQWIDAIGMWGFVTLHEGGNAIVAVRQSRLTQLEGALKLGVKMLARKRVPEWEAEGQINGRLDTDKWAVNGDFDVALKTALEIPIGKQTDKIVVHDGSKIAGVVKDSSLGLLTLDVGLDYHRGEKGLFLQGHVTDGKYDGEAGEVSFGADLTLKQPLDTKVGSKWTLRVEPEVTNLAVKVTKNALDSVSGNIDVSLREAQAADAGGEPLMIGKLTGLNCDLTTGLPQLSGQLDLGLAKAISWPRGKSGMPEQLKLTAKETTHFTAKLEKNALALVSINADAEVHAFALDRIATAHLDGTWDSESDEVNGKGFVVLDNHVPFGVGKPGEPADPTTWAVIFEKGSKVDIAMTKSALDPATVKIDVTMGKGDDDLAKGSVSGQYKFADDAGFTGDFDFHLLEDIEAGTAGRFVVALGKDTKAHGKLAASAITDATGVFVLAAREPSDPKKDVITAAINTTYAGGKLNGTAELKVLERVRIGSRRLGAHDYSLNLDPQTKGSVVVKDNAPGLVTGQIYADIAMDGASFARAEVGGSFDLADPNAKVTADARLQIFAAAKLGKVGAFTFSIVGGTAISARIEDNALAWLSGNMTLAIATDREGEVARLRFDGRYEGGDKPAFDGNCDADIQKAFLLGYKAFGYDFGLAPSKPILTLAKGNLVKASGDIKLLAQQFGNKDKSPLGSLVVALNGDYTRDIGAAQGSFSGKGTCDVTGRLRVGQAGDYEFFVLGGTGVGISVENNEFTELKGGLVAEVHQLRPKAGEDKAFLGLQTEVTYRPKDGGRIDAKGACTLLGRKEVLHGQRYSFWLTRGKGGGTRATVEIVDNTLVQVGGTISCEVWDGHKQPLVRAEANGSWDRASNEFSGSGDIRVGRELTFPEGATNGAKVVIREGSGGGGVVTKNRIERLNGDIFATIHDKGGKLVSINAKGEYDATTNTVVKAVGAATLLRPIYVGGDTRESASIVIHKLGGEAEIEDNALVAVSGVLSFELPKLGGGMKGSFDGGWTNKDGKDSYWGHGTLAFGFLDDKEKGRKLKGDLAASFEKDGSWKIAGHAEYALTPKIKTMADVEIDEKLDPKIDATFSITKVPLVKGRELFSTNMTLFKMSYLFISGGVTAGFSLAMKDLLFSTTIGVQNWHPLGSGKREEMPTFEADLALDTGIDLKAKVAAYIMLGIDIFIAALGGGVEGAAELEVPIDFSPSGKIYGNSRDGLSGELDIGLTIAAIVNLIASPFFKASLLGWEWKKDWPFTHSIPLFDWKWGTRYYFGDNPKSPTAFNPSAVVAKKEGGKKAPFKQDAKIPVPPAPLMPESRPSAPAPEAGAPALDPARQGTGDKQPEKQGMPGQLGEMLEKYAPVLEAMKWFGVLTNLVTPLLKWIMMGPPGWVILMIKMWLLRDPSWGDIAEAAEKVVEAARNCWALFQSEVTNFKVKFMLDKFLGPKPSLLDALFGDDDAVRDEVDKGTHRQLDVEGRAQFIDIMCSGYCSEADQERILVILLFTEKNGDIFQLAKLVEYDILNNLDGYEDDQARLIEKRTGVDFG